MPAVTLLAAALLQALNLEIFFQSKDKKEFICGDVESYSWSSSNLGFASGMINVYIDREMNRIFANDNGLRKSQSEQIYTHSNNFLSRKPWDEGKLDWSAVMINYIFNTENKATIPMITHYEPTTSSTSPNGIMATSMKGQFQSSATKNVFFSYYGLNKTNIIESIEKGNADVVGQDYLIDALSTSVAITLDKISAPDLIQKAFGPVAAEAKESIKEGYVPYGFEKAFDKDAAIAQLNKILSGVPVFDSARFSKVIREMC